MPEQQMSEEQVKALQEKIKNMSPEELKQFQKQQCIFCQIISGKVQSKKIYEDDICMAILDINPANPGHILLMPKEHYALMPMVPDDDLSHLSMVSKALSHILLNTLKAGGVNIFIANGIAAGQRAQHFMIHLIPRKEGDGIPLDIPQKQFSRQEILAVKEKILQRVQAIFNLKKSVVEIEEKKEEQPKKAKEESAKTKPAETKKPKPEIKEAEFEDIEEDKFITSSKAKRYHQVNCAFAQNISEDKRIYITEEEAKEQGKRPCTCITGKKIPMDKESEKPAKKKEEVPKKDKKTEHKQIKSAEDDAEPKEESGDVSLDDIADLLK